MKRLKRGLAVVLMLLLMIPTQPLMAVSAAPMESVIEQESGKEEREEKTLLDEEEEEKTEEKEAGDKKTEEKKEEDEEKAESEGKEELKEKENEKENKEPEKNIETPSGEKDKEEAASPAGSTEDAPAAGEEQETEEHSAEEEKKEDLADQEEEKEEQEPVKEDITEKKKPLAAKKKIEAKKENLEEDEASMDEEELAKEEEILEGLLALLATPSELEKKVQDEVKFNTGNHTYCVVSAEDFENGFGDVQFDEEGNYTIQIPEENPFFPYEVQFTYKGKTINQWFMTPEDRVTIGGHEFYVSAYFDGTVVTQMSLEVAGDTVVVYPEKKEFTDDNGIMTMSLLPLEERVLNVDLTGYTPVELTMVSVDALFGNNNLKDTDKIVWSYQGYKKQTVSQPGDKLDLSWDTMYGGYRTWQMIVGDDNQLAADNIRYIVNLKVTESRDWLIPVVYMQDAQGNRKEISILSEEYRDEYDDPSYTYGSSGRGLSIAVSEPIVYPSSETDMEYYLGLKINPAIFKNTNYAWMNVCKEEHGYGDSIANQIFTEDMTEIDAGYQCEPHDFITMVTYDESGEMTGKLSLGLFCYQKEDTLRMRLFDGTDKQRKQIAPLDSIADEFFWDIHSQIEKGYAADKEYYLVCQYYKNDQEDQSSLVTAAYVGGYSSIAEAVNAGAVDIKDKLFDSSSSGGYKADYSKGVEFTVFVGEDDSQESMIYSYRFKTKSEEGYVGGSELVTFRGLRNAEGQEVGCYIPDGKNDNYGDGKYQFILVEESVDLTKLAPVFTTTSGARLRLPGSQKDEVSGESLHDFSNGPLHYTAITDKETKNYWLHIIKAESEEGKLYINSLDDEEAKTRIESGVIYSTREIVLDSRCNFEHDILLVNIGRGDIPDLKAEIDSNEIKLDDYWTLKGGYALKGLDAVSGGTAYGELQNLAKLHIRPKFGIPGRGEIKIDGTLTIKSGEKTLMVLTLTGTIGDPGIITEQDEIPDAVQYVPYGVVIRNNNKYDWNKVTYSVVSGTLPAGMELRKNGELYGVPKETGTFEFTVRMRNSYPQFPDSESTFNITVIENSDANVDGATDPGYELIRRVPDITFDSYEDQLMISQGVYDEFVDIFLDGVKLQPGVDYVSESGSTRITIKGQTLNNFGEGTHTLGLEFRTKDNILKRAAQNYRVSVRSESNNSENNGSNSNNSGSSNNSSSGRSKSNDAVASMITWDPKKGYVHVLNGVITGNSAGYSSWFQDEKGWKLTYADGSTANGYLSDREDKTTVEQILWEKINGAWYAFGADGYLKSGWVYDYQLNGWYSVSVDTGMREGWYTDEQDMQTYYLEPQAGKLAAGWKVIDSAWYYFNTIVSAPAWEFDKESRNWYYNTKSKSKPFGAMYRNEKTPDGYFVNDTGAWDGN